MEDTFQPISTTSKNINKSLYFGECDEEDKKCLALTTDVSKSYGKIVDAGNDTTVEAHAMDLGR